MVDSEPPKPADDARRGADIVKSDGSLLRLYRHGDQDAARLLYLRYAGRLRALAHSRTASDLAGRVDDDDIVQSVFGSFFRGVIRGAYDVPAGEELWNLFLVITLNKIRAKGEHHRAAKRDVRQTIGGDGVDRAQDPLSSDGQALALLKNGHRGGARPPSRTTRPGRPAQDRRLRSLRDRREDRPVEAVGGTAPSGKSGAAWRVARRLSNWRRAGGYDGERRARPPGFERDQIAVSLVPSAPVRSRSTRTSRSSARSLQLRRSRCNTRWPPGSSYRWSSFSSGSGSRTPKLRRAIVNAYRGLPFRSARASSAFSFRLFCKTPESRSPRATFRSCSCSRCRSVARTRSCAIACSISRSS